MNRRRLYPTEEERRLVRAFQEKQKGTDALITPQRLPIRTILTEEMRRVLLPGYEEDLC